MKLPFTFVLLLFFTLGTYPSCLLAITPADVAAPRTTPDGKPDAYFNARHALFMKRKSQGRIDVLFIGDSITENWEGSGNQAWAKYFAPLNAAEFGISADMTQYVLWRIENGELDGLSPKVVVLLIGTNNIFDYNQDEIMRGEKKIVQEIRQKLPASKILLLGIFPRGGDPKDPQVAVLRSKIKQVNQELSKLDDGHIIRYLDIGNRFLDSNGRIPDNLMPDKLHPNANGYETWAQAVLPLLHQMLQ